MIACGNCHHKSMTLEPFTILSLSLPASGKFTLANLLKNYYKECCSAVLTIIVPSATKVENVCLESPFNISARKKQNYVDFPLRQLSLGEHALNGVNLASYDLCVISNHHGTMNGRHYTGYCKPPQGDVWYQCDNKTVTRLRTPVKMSTAYYCSVIQFMLISEIFL